MEDNLNRIKPVETVDILALHEECKADPGKYSELQIMAIIQGNNPCVGGNAIEDDLLPTIAFPCVEWLSCHGMRMYRWEGDTTAWHSFALNITSTYVNIVKRGVPAIIEETHCPIKLADEMLYGKKVTFVILFRGSRTLNCTEVTNFDLALNKLSDLLANAMGGDHIAPSCVTSETIAGCSRGSIIANTTNTAPSTSASGTTSHETVFMAPNTSDSKNRVDVQVDIQRRDADLLKLDVLHSIQQTSECQVVKLNKAIKGRGPFKLRLKGSAEAVGNAQAMVRKILTSDAGVMACMGKNTG